MAGIFISYRRDDSAYIAAAINEKFQQRFGDENVFFDIDTIPLGVDFRDHIGGAVGGCDVLLVVIGDQWVNAKDKAGEQRLHQATDYVRVEIESALQRNVPVVPILVGNALMPTEAELPESIRSLAFRNAAEVRAGRDLSEHLERLVRDVGKVAGIVPLNPAGAEGGKARGGVGSASGSGVASSRVAGSPTAGGASASKRRGPLIAAGVVIVVGVGLVIAFATGVFQSGDKGSKTDGAKDQVALKDDRPADKDSKNDKDANAHIDDKDDKDDKASTPDDTKQSAGTPTKVGTDVGAKDAKPVEPVPPAALDRSDAKATAVAILTSYKARDFNTLVDLLHEDNREIFAELAEQGEKHPRYNSIFHGWRGDAVKTWTGKVEEPRYEKRASDAGRIKAIVRFEQKGLTPLVVVAMFLNDGKWEFEDIESPPAVLYEKMSTEIPE